jgi:serine/threonine protein phosphatase PrpC
MKYSSKSLTHVGKVRKANEDNLGQSPTPNGQLFVVCDGMGGHVGGAQASSIAVNSIIEFFQRDMYDNVIQAIDHALSFANEQIYASALSNPELKGMGTTAVILLIRGEECFIGHVGDSRIYLRSNRKLNRITKDHSFVQSLVDSGIIHDDEAENHPKKNQILQALGISPMVKATICQSPILTKAGDMFLLCSDGLNGMVNDRDIERIMQEDNLEVTCGNLITAALNGGGTDNITASLVLIQESAFASSNFVHFNPKPKVNDLASTQVFAGAATKSIKRKTKLLYLIGGTVFLLAGFITVMLLMDKEEAPYTPEKRYTMSEIQTYPCKSIGDITVEMKVDFKEGEISNSECGEKEKSVFIVKDSTIIQIKKLGIIEIEEPGEKNPAPKTPPAPKGIMKMTEKEIKALKVGDPVKEANGEFTPHGFKIVIKDHKVTSKEKAISEIKDDGIIKTHIVKNKETLGKIVAKYIDVSPGLTTDALQDYNVEDKNSALTKKQKESLSKGIIDIGMKLKIPKMK